MDQIHQPVNLFLPTEAAMSALAQEQKDFLYAMHNRDQLAEFLKYHIVRDTKVGLYPVCWFFWKEHSCINDDRKFSVDSLMHCLNVLHFIVSTSSCPLSSSVPAL